MSVWGAGIGGAWIRLGDFFGLTPVAFFPPEPTQQLQAFSVIFLEAPLKKRKRRHVEGRGLDKLYGPFYKHFKYYKANLWRFTNMVRRGEFDKLLRPGKFSTEPLNNLGQILRFTDAHFGGLVNSTKTRYNIWFKIKNIWYKFIMFYSCYNY